MNMRTPEHQFRSRRTADVSDDQTSEMGEPAILEQEHALQDAAPANAVTDEAQAQDEAEQRFLLCSKSSDMIDNVRRAVGDGDDVVIDLAGQSLCELAEGDPEALSGHDIIVIEIDPSDHAEMAALRQITARATGGTRFLAITPQELTMTVARELMDAGVMEVLPMSALRGADAAAAQMAPSAAEHNGMVLTIAQTRGGIGATTLAVNLAALLSAPKSRRDKRPAAKIALLDLDIQNGDAAASIDIEDNGELIDLLRTKTTPDAAFLHRAMVSYKNQFDVLPTPVEFAPFDALTPATVTQLIVELRKKYDYVILGLPRSMVAWLAPVLAHTDQMLLVTDTTVPGVRQARRLIDFFAEANPSMPLDLVVSREKKPMSLPKAVKEATKFLEKPFDIWLPDDLRTANKAGERGVPMVEVSKRSPAVKSLRQIVNKMTQIQDSGKRRKA